MHSRLSYKAQLRIFLLPYVVGSLILVIIPALATVAVAFTEYNAIQPPHGPVSPTLSNCSTRRWHVSHCAAPLFSSAYRHPAAHDRCAAAGPAVYVITPPFLHVSSRRRLLAHHHSRSCLRHHLALDIQSALRAAQLVSGLFGVNDIAWLTDPATAQAAIILCRCLRLAKGLS